MELEEARVAVTGGAGFIGSHLVDHLVERGAHVKCIDDLSFGKVENVNATAEFVRMNILSGALMGIIEDVDLVFHFAANATTKESQLGWNNPEVDSQVNTLGTLKILEAIRHSRSRPAMILASTAAVYGMAREFPIKETHPTDPVSPYGVSKLASEKYAFAYATAWDLKISVLRIFNTYGPRQPRYVMYDIFKKLESDTKTLELLGTGTEVRDYSFVGDTVRAALLIAETDLWGEVYNIAGGQPITILKLAKMILQELGREDKVHIVTTGSSWRGDLKRLEGDIAKIKSAGFVARYSLEEGLGRTLSAFAAETT